MKTSKEMQLRILDKMRENVESGKPFYQGLEYKNTYNDWVEEVGQVDLDDHEYRIKPETITINGYDIPKPLRDSEILEDVIYYYVDNNKSLYEQRFGEFIHAHGIRFVYSTAEEAITASKLLFGLG